MNKEIKMISWNVNGIRACIKKGFLEWFKNEAPDILALQETKIQKNDVTDEMAKIKGYKLYHSFAEKKGYSGTFVYVKDTLEVLNENYGFGVEKFDREGRIVELEFKDFIFYNIYFPNGQRDDERLNYKMEFYDKFLELANNHKENGKNVVTCGDFNTAHQEMDLKNPKANAKRSGFLQTERDWLTKFTTNGYTDTFRNLYPEKIEYSWWSYRFNARKNNAGWRIDYFFVNNEFMKNLTDAKIYTDVLGSDHCPVVIEVKI